MKGGFFNKLGLADMEKVHSSVIGWVFSEDCDAFNNDVKSELLCKLFKEENKKFNEIQSDIETHNIDILITTKDEIGNKECWVVENKIKSSQHDNQLDKYVGILEGEKEYKKGKYWNTYKDNTKHFCFLTLIKEDPEGDYANKWHNVLYSEFLSFLSETIQKESNNTHLNFLEEYAQCVRMMTDSLDAFLKNPSNFAFVFEKKAKDEKDYDEIKNHGENALYIAKNGLETIFQKCLLKEWINKLGLDKGVQKTVFVEEWRSNATFAVIPSCDYDTIDESLRLQVEFQDGSFKVVLISKDHYFKDCTKDIEKVNNLSACFENRKEWNVQRSKHNRKPRISITKKMEGIWFENFDNFMKGYNEAVEKAQNVFEQIQEKLKIQKRDC